MGRSVVRNGSGAKWLRSHVTRLVALALVLGGATAGLAVTVAAPASAALPYLEVSLLRVGDGSVDPGDQIAFAPTCDFMSGHESAPIRGSFLLTGDGASSPAQSQSAALCPAPAGPGYPMVVTADVTRSWTVTFVPDDDARLQVRSAPLTVTVREPDAVHVATDPTHGPFVGEAWAPDATADSGRTPSVTTTGPCRFDTATHPATPQVDFTGVGTCSVTASVPQTDTVQGSSDTRTFEVTRIPLFVGLHLLGTTQHVPGADAEWYVGCGTGPYTDGGFGGADPTPTLPVQLVDEADTVIAGGTVTCDEPGTGPPLRYYQVGTVQPGSTGAFRAVIPGSGDYAGGTSAPFTYHVVTPQTLSVTPPTERHVGATWTPDASSEPNHIAVPPVASGGACTSDATSVHLVAPGRCHVGFDLAAGPDNAPASASVEFPVIARTATSLSASPASPEAGQTYSLTADVTSTAGDPEGAVYFYRDGVLIAGITLDAHNQVTWSGLVATAGTDPQYTAVFYPTETEYYDGSSADLSLHIKTPQAIQVEDAPSTGEVGGSWTPVTTGGASTNPVTITTAPASQDVCTVDHTGQSVDFLTPGTCEVRFDQAGTTDYDAAPRVTKQLTISRRPTPDAPPGPPDLEAHTTAAHPAHHGWYDGPVTVTFTCTTHGTVLTSGCPDPVTLTTDGRDQSVQRTITANDGQSDTATVTVSIDTTDPTVTIDGVTDGKRYRHHPDATCTATDALSGLDTCTLERTKLRRHHFQLTALATDTAGNTTTSTVTYTKHQKHHHRHHHRH